VLQVFVDGLLDGHLASAVKRAREHLSSVWMAPFGQQTKMVSFRLCSRQRSPRGWVVIQARSTANSRAEFGEPVYNRVEAQPPRAKRNAGEALAGAGPARRSVWRKNQTILTHAPGNGAPIGGLKVIAESGWFAARPSGTENIYKIYAESFRGEEHLRRILEEAQAIVSDAWRRSKQGLHPKQI